MPTPTSMPMNLFKQALQRRQVQVGLWLGLADAAVAEAVAGTGFDWLLIDGEHAPNDLRSVQAQLQAIAPYPSQPVVRPPVGDVVLIKQLLELGTQTLLIPMVETAEQAAQMVAATRYPPRGLRGVGSALARSSRWNQVGDYLDQADSQMCVLLQVETVRGLDQVAEIAAVDGVDGVFFGPADLSASLGLLGQPDHPRVRQLIGDGIAAVAAAGKAPGVFAPDPAVARGYIEAGAVFIGVGVDAILMVRACRDLAALHKAGPGTGEG